MKKTIVLCGSMKVKDKIVELAKKLEDMGYDVLLPVECMQGLDKMIASRAHLNRVIDENNEIILVVNEPKNGIDNYIGANSFVEVGFGYFFNKRVYLLNDIYEPYKDELVGWGVTPLKRDLSKIK